MDLDYDNDRVLKLIFPNDKSPDTSEAHEYVQKLCSMPLTKLKKEEVSLTQGTSQIISQTEDIAISNYKTFIKAAECSRDIHKGFQDTSAKLDKLLEKLPQFQEKCDNFVNISKKIAESRRINGLTLKNNTELLEILELPQLMNNCIREEKYEEALELSGYVLGMKCSGIPIISEIVGAVEASWYTMLTQMLGQLKTDIQLPKCLQIIGYIKRMQAFTEPELKLKFLQLRDSYLKDVLASIPTDDPQQHLLRTVEVTRVCLFNIITQYRAIFLEEESATTKLDPIGTIKIDSNKIFHSWLHEKIDEFLSTLEHDLARGCTSLETCLGQCMYFGLSLSRVGADFRGLMASIFIQTITKKFTDAVYHCTRQFEIDIEAYTLINKPAGTMRRRKSSAEPVEGNQPPETLLDFYPLGVYTNGLLTIFNELRICSPIAIADSVTKTLQISLEAVAKSILNFYRQEQQAFTPTERDHFFMFITSFAYDLVPYIQRCIHFIFPPSVLATNLGINVLQLQKESLTYLNQKQILERLQHLLPNKMEVLTNATDTVSI
uniref:Conserved oligomeric Golgi complex subunit 8 n=1 Tax=Culicoides sonorensis TaxID=179676 RepID=A0A336K8C4_CULSO